MDQITLNRIQTLHPKIRKKVLDAYVYINNKLLGKGVRLRFAHTTRTIEEQNELYSQGRTKLYDKNGKRLGKVTQAKGGESIHNYHLAFDIVLLYDKNGDGTFETASWTIDEHWDRVVSYFKSKGYEWGGDWKSFKDKPHFEKNFGFDWKTLKSRFDRGIIINDNGITYPKI